MSGVTVATISRSTSAARLPARSSAARAAGRARSDIASVSAATLRSLIPVRVVIHSSAVSTIRARSSFVSTRSGTWQPSPVIETGRPAVPFTARLRASPLHREGQRAAHRELPVHARAHPAPADRPAHGLDLAEEVEGLAGPDDPLEADVVDPGEERELAPVLLLREHRHGPALGERLDHLHSGHDRIPGKVAGAVVLRDRLASDDAGAGDELEHLVDKEEGVAMREDRLQLAPAEGRLHARTLDAMELTPEVVLPALRGRFGDRTTTPPRPPPRRRCRRRTRPTARWRSPSTRPPAAAGSAGSGSTSPAPA